MAVHYITTPRPIPDGIQFVASQYAVCTDDRLLFITNDTTASFDVTLPSAAEFFDLQFVVITGTIRLLPKVEGQLIQGASSLTLTVGTFYNLVSDGTSKQYALQGYSVD